MCDREPLLKRPHRGNRLPSSCKSIEVGGAIQIISEGPDKPILQFGPDGFGDCPKPVKWPKPRIPELFNAHDLKTEIPDSERAYIRLDRIGGGQFSAVINGVELDTPSVVEAATHPHIAR